ncbi:MAG: cytochrome c [Acidimicrobiales bacterium]|jgi:mono/diheme cytochrome c family protein|nr:cytochrome c [Acidimicrobiales bacterium]
MFEHDPHPEPDLQEAAFYGGVGLIGGLVVALAMGLSFIGYHEAAETPPARNAAAADQVAAGDAADQISLGEQVYASRCASCHGAAGEGGVGPSFVGVVDRAGVAEHETLVREGQGQMPSFDALLSDAQIAEVIAFEREVLDGG